MKRLTLCVLFSVLMAMPAGAQDILAGAPAQAPALDLSAAVVERALQAAPLYAAVPVQSQSGNFGRSTSSKAKTLYFLTLAAAGAGVVYNIKTTREALDKHLEARTFPLVWKKTTDPEDKNKVTGIIAATNGGILAIGAVLFKKNNAPFGTFLNSLVAGATTIVGLHNQSVINDCETAACQE